MIFSYAMNNCPSKAEFTDHRFLINYSKLILLDDISFLYLYYRLFDYWEHLNNYWKHSMQVYIDLRFIVPVKMM